MTRPQNNDKRTGGERNRREFLLSLGRWVGLAGLAALVGRSALGPRSRAGAVSPCDVCPSLPGCGRPDGIRTRKAMAVPRRDDGPARAELCLAAETAQENEGKTI